MYQDIDYAIKLLATNPAFMAGFGATSPATQKQGLGMLREKFREVHYSGLAAEQPIFQGLYQRADSIVDVTRNEAYIRDSVAKRKLEIRADANDGLIFQPDLRQLEARIFETKYRPRGMWRGVMPQAGVVRGVKYVEYRIFDRRGEVKPITTGTVKDIPYVGVSGKAYQNYIIDKALGYRYTQMELDAAAFAGAPLDMRLRDAVVSSYEEAQDNVAFGGDTEFDLEGLINHTGVPNIQAAAAAAGSNARPWAGADKVPDEIVADIRGMVTAIAVASGENYNADRTQFILLVPRVPYDALNQRMAAGTDTTILQFVLNQKKYGIADIKVLPQLAGQGTGSTNLAIMLPIMDREVIEFYTSDAIIWEPPQLVGFDIRFPSRQRVGGVVIRYLIAMTQLYGI